MTMKWYHWVLLALKALVATGAKHVEKHGKDDKVHNNSLR